MVLLVLLLKQFFYSLKHKRLNCAEMSCPSLIIYEGSVTQPHSAAAFTQPQLDLLPEH